MPYLHKIGTRNERRVVLCVHLSHFLNLSSQYFFYIRTLNKTTNNKTQILQDRPMCNNNYFTRSVKSVSDLFRYLRKIIVVVDDC
jgi:hypothetical protein